MNKIISRSMLIAAVAVLLSCIFGVSALAETAYVMKSARVYQEASTSSKSVKVSAGTEVEVVAEKNGWAMVKKGGYTGYMKASALEEVETYSNTTVYTTARTAVYKSFSTSSKKLGTLAVGSELKLKAVAGDWACITMGGKTGFVKKSQLTTKAPEKEEENTAENEIQKVNKTAYAARDGVKVYKSYTTSSKVLCKLDANTAVKVTAIKGDWCRVENKGVVAFMKKSDLSDSKIGVESEETAPAEPTGESTSKPASGEAKEMDWWTSGIQSIFARGTVVTVTDVETGISWKEIRKGGTNHADVQPLTAEDTAAMKKAVGSWSWERRAIWVTIDGQKYAASMNCMPHGGDSVKDNNFDGHHCIHFTNSRTHGGNKVCAQHQAAIKKAVAASK